MKETKQASGSPEARDVVREMMAAFEAVKGANDARLGEIEKKAAADVLLEEKVARIDQAVASAQARLDRVMSQSRRPAIGGERLRRSGPTVEAVSNEDLTETEHAIEVTYEGSYELDETTLADGSALDDHFSAMGGWITSTLVRLGDLRFEFLPPLDKDGEPT